jgi:hypothetical protein
VISHNFYIFKIYNVLFKKHICSGLVYFSGIFIPKRCGDKRGFGVHSILSNPSKYSSPKILYYGGEFLI